VVDDDDAVRESLDVLLSAHGYCVRSYNTAEAFLTDLPEEPNSALALVDLDMPGMGGEALLRRLAGRMATVAMSGRIECDPIDGQTRLLRKPFASEDLLAVIGLARRPA
jgi:FixJ family two-component response regulator